MVLKVKQIRKRDGRIVAFEPAKITEAIYKAAQSVGGYDKGLAENLTKEIVAIVEKSFQKQIPNVEDIQDIVEKVLIERGHAKTAKAYILYRQKHKELRDAKQMLLDSEKVVRDYIAKEDWSVYENANVGYSMAGLLWHGIGTVMNYYGLNSVYSKEISNMHIEGDLHIHNLSMPLCGYCAGWSLRQLLHEGFNGVSAKLECKPPKHISSAIGQMINFIGTMQNEWAGAQAFSSFDTYLAPFVRADRLNYARVKQAMQEYVYNMNVSSRWGGQCAFTNITLDLTTPSDLEKQKATVGGKLQKETYDDYSHEAEMINKALIEVLIEGDAKGRVFTFPIPTYNITKSFKWNGNIADSLFEMTAKYGLPYFQNFLNSDLKPSDVRAMCCRLRLNMKELHRNARGGLFGSGESTGSVGVVTINMPRIGYQAKNEKDFFERLERMMYMAKNSLEIKRKVVEKNIENGLLPYTKRYLGNLKSHFSTIGIVGMNECCLNFLREGIETKEGREFALKVLKFMRNELIKYQNETGNIYNLEATPAEGSSYRLAKIDRHKFPKIITAGKETPYYTNSSNLPVNYTDDVFAALKHQEPLQENYTGGTVFHTLLGESLNSGNEARLLVKKIATNFRLPYFTITPTFSICPEHGFISGKHEKCSVCGKETEVYSRVVGYLRPVKNWNIGKQEEFKQRKTFKISSFTK